MLEGKYVIHGIIWLIINRFIICISISFLNIDFMICRISRLKKISCLSLKRDESCVYIGTEGGNVYTLDANKFEITDKTIYMDVVLQK